MKVEKGQLLRIKHVRKGTFVARVLRDFDSKEETWFPVAPAEESVGGMDKYYSWAPGEEIPCRASFARIIGVL